LIKAELIDGQIRHLVDKPEIHGDPMIKDGASVYHIPCWDIVRMAKYMLCSRTPNLSFIQARLVELLVAS
jgi:hypothetical protein